MSHRPSRRAALIGACVAGLHALALPRAARAQTDAADIGRVEAYFNRIATLQSDFTQFGADGRTATGKFYLSRPGRLRFAYDPPSKVLVVADGLRVVYQDFELGQSTQVLIAQTPLAVLLDSPVDLKSGRVSASRVERRPGTLRLTVLDRKKPEEGSMLIEFGDNPLELRNWRVTDAQGQQTTVALSNLQFDVAIRPDLFRVVEKMPGEGR
jgi:outer membrane lipoprotein-sorting protein